MKAYKLVTHHRTSLFNHPGMKMYLDGQTYEDYTGLGMFIYLTLDKIRAEDYIKFIVLEVEVSSWRWLVDFTRNKTILRDELDPNSYIRDYNQVVCEKLTVIGRIHKAELKTISP